MTEVLRVKSWDDVPAHATSGSVLLELDNPMIGDAALGIERLAALDVPVIGSLSGAGGPELLAGALACSIAVADPSLRIELSDSGRVLALGLTWALERRNAAWLLFAAQPLTVADLLEAGIVRTGVDPHELALALAADPGRGLLVRSLRAAGRSTRAQARVYDAELIAMMEADRGSAR